MDKREAAVVEVEAKAQADFVQDIKKRSVGTVWFTGCKSWYIDKTGRNSPPGPASPSPTSSARRPSTRQATASAPERASRLAGRGSRSTNAGSRH